MFVVHSRQYAILFLSAFKASNDGPLEQSESDFHSNDALII